MVRARSKLGYTLVSSRPHNERGLTDKDRAMIRNLFGKIKELKERKPWDLRPPVLVLDKLIERHTIRIQNKLRTIDCRRVNPQCWACGRSASKRNHNCAEGWASRPLYIPGGARTYREIYCPQCFDEWGWPEEYNSPRSIKE